MCLLRWQFNKESIECEIEHSYSLAQRAEAGLAIPRSLSLFLSVSDRSTSPDDPPAPAKGSSGL